MKQIYFIIILLILNIIPLSSKPDSTYWIDKGDFIDIHVPRWRGQGVDLCIYDIRGMEITTPSLRDTPPYQGGEIVRLDVSGLLPGVYFVRVGEVVKKFVKL